MDIYKHRRRYRLFKAILLGAALAGLTALILAMIDGGKNPCARVRDYFCKKDPTGIQCKSYVSLVDDSQHDSSPAMRSNIRAQCESKIEGAASPRRTASARREARPAHLARITPERSSSRRRRRPKVGSLRRSGATAAMRSPT